jgi:hypothetical protein
MPTAKPKTLADALLAVQREAITFQKDKVNPAFSKSRYASTDSILEALLPKLSENELVLTQLPSSVGDQPALRTRITFAPTGEFIEDVGLLMLDKQNAQGLGGAITYMRRYAVTSIFGLVGEADDDGNAASATAKPKRKVGVANKRSASRPNTDADGTGDW